MNPKILIMRKIRKSKIRILLSVLMVVCGIASAFSRSFVSAKEYVQTVNGGLIATSAYSPNWSCKFNLGSTHCLFILYYDEVSQFPPDVIPVSNVPFWLIYKDGLINRSWLP